MKKFLFMAMASLSLNFLSAQAPLHLESPEIAQRVFDQAFIPKIKGKLLNYSETEDPDLMIKYVLLNLGPEMQETHTLEISPDGSFEVNLDLGLPYQQMWFSIGDYYYGQIIGNKDLEIEADLEILKKESVNFYGPGIQFRGTDGDLVSFLNQYTTFQHKSDPKFELDQRIQALSYDMNGDPSKKIEKLRTFFKEKKVVLDAFMEENPSSYRWIVENELNSQIYGKMAVFYWNPKYQMSAEVLEEILAHKPMLVSNDSYLYYSYMGSMLGRHDVENFAKKIQELPQRKSDILKLVSQPKDLYQRVKYLDKILPITQSSWCKKQMQVSLKEDEQRITQIEESLKSSPLETEATGLGINRLNLNDETRLYLSEEESAESLVKSLRSVFKDKAIIVDVWATWCGPCISDMQQSKDIKKEIKKLPAEIVYLCVSDGSSEDKWKKKVAELEVAGNHIFIDRELSAKLMKSFKLSGYPSYIFIDKEGNIDQEFIKRISMIDIEELKKRL